MQKQQQETAPKQSVDMVQKAEGQEKLKNQNPNQNHNTKKVALGPNTKR
ncbi:hypothetical protein [Oscillibacter sp.]|nr:hypothetical protein [Oscillibacter sp.]